MPGLDPSWALAVNQAVAQKLAFGREFIFTFGPYGGLFTRFYHPDTYGLIVLAGLLLAVAGSVCLVAAAGIRGFRRGAWVALALLLPFPIPDGFLFFLALVAGLALAGFGAPAAADPPGSGTTNPRTQDRAAPYAAFAPDAARTRCAAFVPYAAFAVLGFLPLIKASLLTLCVAIGGLGALQVARTAGLATVLGAVLTGIAAALGAWWAAGQAIADLPNYIGSSLPLISAYSDAMSSRGRNAEPLVYLLGAAVLLVVLWRRPGSRLAWLMVLLFLFQSFKAGFVRHDGHALIAGEALLLAAAVVQLSLGRAAATALFALAVAGSWLICKPHADVSVSAVAEQTQAQVASAARGAVALASGRDGLAARYRDSLQAIHRRAGLDTYPGGVDLYTAELATLFASGNRWKPRPVVQSYLAYAPALAETNRLHLLGDAAAQYLAVKLDPIDLHYPLSEDGPSWPEIIARYDVHRRDHGMLVLARSGRSGPQRHPIATASARFGERVEIPQLDEPIFARLAIEPSLVGRLVQFAFRPDALLLELETADGRKHEFRLPQGFAQAGFLISPFVATVDDLESLMVRNGRLQRVVGLTVRARRAGSMDWLPGYRAEFTRVAVNEPNAHAPGPGSPSSAARPIGTVRQAAGQPE